MKRFLTFAGAALWLFALIFVLRQQTTHQQDPIDPPAGTPPPQSPAVAEPSTSVPSLAVISPH